MGLVAASMGFGVLLGTAFIAGSLFALRTIQAAGDLPGQAGQSGTVLLLLGGTLGGILLAGMAAWVILASITSTYRRGALSLVTGFATLLLSLLAMPADRFLGRLGLAGLAAVCAAGCFWVGRRTFGSTRGV